MQRTILITGTSSGIGRATALRFQAEGWNVVATQRHPEQERHLNQLERVRVTRLDVEDLSSIPTAVEVALSQFGQIDVLLNNAGYGAYGPLEATPIDHIRRQFDVNVLGLLATTQAVLSHFRARRQGLIMNVSSIGGRFSFPLGSLYHGSKFAVEGLSEALHYELLPLGVRVKLIEPGMVKTEFAGRSLDFCNDPQMSEYQPLVQQFMATLGALAENAAAPEMVAECIWRAANDGRDQLRYEAGDDAAHWLSQRRQQDDTTFIGTMRGQFGLGQ